MDKAGASIYPAAMPLSREEIAAAEKMHRFVRCHEMKSARGALAAPILGTVPALISTHARHPQLFVWYLAVLAVSLLSCALVRRLASARCQRDKVLLQVLERDHADALPWIRAEREEAEIERHLSAVREIELELSRGHRAT